MKAPFKTMKGRPKMIGREREQPVPQLGLIPEVPGRGAPLSRRPLLTLRRPFRQFMLALVGLVCTAAASVAHEGHDHGPAPAPLPAATKPRVAVQTEAFELVGIAANGQLSLFLDKFATNEPVTDAD